MRGWTTSTSAQYIFVLSKKIRTEDYVPSTLPRQEGDHLLLCQHKAAQWLLATPLKIGWTVQGPRGGRQPPPPTPVDRRHYPTKTMSTEDSRQKLSSLLGCLWQPLAQDDKGKEDLGAIKGGRPPLRGDSILISGLLARLSWFFYLRPVRALQPRPCTPREISRRNTRRQEVGALPHHEGPEPG
jgi:hypothetical protein